MSNIEQNMNLVMWLNQHTGRANSQVAHLQNAFGLQQNELPPETWRISSST
jgi:hypothetical protein